MFEALLKGLTLGLLLSISVGPVIFSIIKQSLNNGHRGGLAFVLGVSASDITLVFVSNVFTTVFSYMVKHQNYIGVGGSMFLIVVGIYFIFFKKVKVDDSGVQVLQLTKRDYIKTFLSGYFMNTLNPAVFIFWLTTSTTLITLSIEYRIIAFATCLVFVLATDVLKVMMAQKIRKKLTPHNIQILSRINGMVLLGFGIVLLWGLIFYTDTFAI
ncbi:MAG TPA: LysE family transporter [Chitinophagaceae bacterium]|nr:LysE family transporter [Chitinophagaceae bacterium]